MKIYCKSEYHNGPMGLHFLTAGIVDVDDHKAEFLLRDAPENFTKEFPVTVEGKAPPSAKALDEPPHDKAMKKPAEKK